MVAYKAQPSAPVAGFSCYALYFRRISLYLFIAFLQKPARITHLKTWSLTTEMIKDHFFTGVGTGNWQINARVSYKGRFSGNDPQNWIRPQNDFLWVMAEARQKMRILRLPLAVLLDLPCFLFPSAFLAKSKLLYN